MVDLLLIFSRRSIWLWIKGFQSNSMEDTSCGRQRQRRERSKEISKKATEKIKNNILML
jgi:hypothetical protein